MPSPPPPPPGPVDNAVSFGKFKGLKNTVGPESLTPEELARATNIDIDDEGQAHRRRGRRLVVSGKWHSLFTTTTKQMFGVKDGVFVAVKSDYSVLPLLAGIADEPLAFVEVGTKLYFSNRYNSAQLDLPSLAVSPWGLVVDPSYQPGLAPGPADWWFSPVENTSDTLGAVGGKLLGAPPPGSFLAHFRGRIYVAAGPVLWATELFVYNYVDKNKSYRLFESDITGLMPVEDGVYVGTKQALYFLQGLFHEHTRTLKEDSGVVPGSMVAVPGELIDPEGRRFPLIPRKTQLGMACLTDAGVVCGLGGGDTFNLTRTTYIFPTAIRSTPLFRQEDGMNTLILANRSGGTPIENARFGDYLDATIVRAGTPGQPGNVGVVIPAAIQQSEPTTLPAGQSQPIRDVYGVDGSLLGSLTEDE